MYKAIILPLAKKDIKDAAKWYNGKQKGIGLKFTTLVRKKVKSIRKNPKHIAARYSNVRTARLDTFPYMIHFTFDENTKTVIISAVFATSDDPEKWKRQL